MEQVTELTAQDVELYLLRHQDYFIGRDRLIKKLTLSHDSGGAISLLERQNELLRAQGTKLQARLDDLIKNARLNDRMFQYLQNMVLAAITAVDITELEQILNDNLCKYFQVDIFRLFVVTEGQDQAKMLLSENILESLQVVTDKLSGSNAYCGSLSQKNLTALFGSELSEGSVAIARCAYESTTVSICLGSKDSSYYRNSMDTLFLNYLAEVTSRLSNSLLTAEV